MVWRLFGKLAVRHNSSASIRCEAWNFLLMVKKEATVDLVGFWQQMAPGYRVMSIVLVFNGASAGGKHSGMCTD
eukprot:1144412-Pelagomonas_calceolata.AAC.2